ncbi:peptidylprolyl isomerase [Candidatus Marinimicrobia bacterium]|jgi:peptidyl-prolyl cis-trans isomerase SurA|nr:peptidylprolyl isomerase [Candidatus Neomarinimicrobiota bacterium]MDA9656519.1 peptidylprolyl isomerase [Candidatus Neomarinimicrobiota bacterium]
MKKFLFLFFIVFVFCEEPVQYIDGVAAVVEDHLILKSDLAQMVNMSAVQSKINPNIDPEKFMKLQSNVLKNMIDQKILLRMAELDSVLVDEKEVDKSLDQQVQTLIFQAGSKKKTEEALGQSINDFKREFWFDMRDRLVSEKYQQSLMASVSITRPGVVSFYKTYKDSLPSVPLKTKVRHILIPIKPSLQSTEKTKETILGFKKEILNGSLFEDIALKNSVDPGSKKTGGSLGWVSRGSLVKNFEVAAFSAQEGDLVGPIKTEFGYHLIETEEKKGDKIKVRHILLTPEITKKDQEKAYNFAMSLQKDSIKTISDFIKNVSLYTSDITTQKIGGDLGWIDPLSYSIPEIGQALKYIDTGACSPPINSDLGFHLIWIEGVKPGGKANLKDHWFEIENLALNKKKMDYYKDWIASAKKEIFIKVFN